MNSDFTGREAPSPFYFLKKRIMAFLGKDSKKEILSTSSEIRLQNKEKEILTRLKDIKGIFYDESTAVLTVTEEMTETKFREILYWARIHSYKEFAGVLANFYKKTHYEYFFKKTHWGSRLDSFYRFFIIKGGNVFSGASPSPKFWLEWRATFKFIDEKKVLKERFWNDLFYYEIIIECSINQIMSKYIFEICGENNCSFIYEKPSMLKNECLPSPFYVDLWQILKEAKEDLNKNFFNQRGLEIEFLHEEKFYPIEKPYLGLCEIVKIIQKKAYAEIYNPIYNTLAKIKRLQEMEGKEEIAEVGNKEDLKTEYKEPLGLKTVNIFPEKPLDRQIEMYPSRLDEDFYKKTKKLLRPLLRFLLESFIQRQDIHWVYGFVIFFSWRKMTRRQINDPAKIFDDYISSLNSFGKEEMLWTIERKSEGPDARHKKGYYEFRNRGFSSNIFEAYHIYEKAKEMSEPLKKKRDLVIAWQKYPALMEVNLTLVDCWVREGFEGVENEDIKKMLRFFENKDYDYSQAYGIIAKKQREKNMDYWDLPSVREVITELLKKSEEIKKYRRLLEQWCREKKILSSDEIEYEELKDLVLQVIKESKENREIDKELLQPQSIAFQQLIQNSTISSAIKIGKEKIRNEYSLEYDFVQKTIEPLEIESLWVIIAENRIDFSKLAALKELKNWLIETLVQEIRKQINEGLLSIETWKSKFKKQFREDL